MFIISYWQIVVLMLFFYLIYEESKFSLLTTATSKKRVLNFNVHNPPTAAATLIGLHRLKDGNKAGQGQNIFDCEKN